MAEWAGLVGKGLIDGGSVDVDFGDDALYSYFLYHAGPAKGLAAVAHKAGNTSPPC
jgi:hypothetical protein